VFLAALAVAGLYWFLHWRAGVQEAELAVMRQEHAARQAEIQIKVKALEGENVNLGKANEALRLRAAQERAKADALAAEAKRLRDAANQRVEAIVGLPLEAVGADVAALIQVPESEITQLPDQALKFTDMAARADLRELVLGQSARQQLELATDEAVRLRVQIDVMEQETANLGQMVKNERTRADEITSSLNMKLDEAHKEMSVVRAKARKRNMVLGAVGFVAGAVVVAVF